MDAGPGLCAGMVRATPPARPRIARRASRTRAMRRTPASRPPSQPRTGAHGLRGRRVFRRALLPVPSRPDFRSCSAAAARAEHDPPPDRGPGPSPGGRVVVDGEEVNRLTESGCAGWRVKLECSSGGALLDSYNVFETRAAPSRAEPRRAPKQMPRKSRAALEAVGVEGVEALLPGNSPAACCGAWRWRGPSSASRRFCSATSRSRLDPAPSGASSRSCGLNRTGRNVGDRKGPWGVTSRRPETGSSSSMFPTSFTRPILNRNYDVHRP